MKKITKALFIYIVTFSLIFLVSKDDGVLMVSGIDAANAVEGQVNNTELTQDFDKNLLERPQEAISWALTEDEDQLIPFIFEKIVLERPRDTVDFFAALHSQSKGSEHLMALAINTVAMNASKIDYSNVEQIQTLEPYLLRETLVTMFAPILFDEHKASIEQITKLIASLHDSDIRNALFYGLAKDLAAADPTQGAAYVETLSAEVLSVHNIGIIADAVVQQWVLDDANQASDWLKTLIGNIDLPANALALALAEQGQIDLADYWIQRITNRSLALETSFAVIVFTLEINQRDGVAYLVTQKNLSTQQKLQFLHSWFPNDYFFTPSDALKLVESTNG